MNTRITLAGFARRRSGRRPVPGLPWPAALALSTVAAAGAAALVRPRRGLIAPDPVEVSEHFSTEELARVRAFSRPQLAIHAAGAAVQAGLLGWTVARPPRRLAAIVPSGRRGVGLTAAAGAGLTALATAVSLPTAALARRRSLRAGLATQSWPGWALDVAKSSAISAGLAGVLAPAALAGIGRRPRDWWLAGAAVTVAGGGVVTFLAPVILDPLFNRFKPLADGDTRADVLDLAARAGVEVREVFEVDASRRTTAANAYVTGLGATKRVVLFDTLLSSFTREEARLVVAHELAHVRHRDVQLRLAHGALVAPAAMYAGAALFARLAVGRSWDPPGPPSAAALPALALALGVPAALAGPIASALSRRVETRADSFSLRLTDAPEPFVSFERRICLQNLADPDPPRWLVALMGSHPPAVKRIGIARAYERSRGTDGRAARPTAGASGPGGYEVPRPMAQ